MNFATIWEGLKGWKTYLLASMSIIVALLGHFFGPITINGNVAVPQFTWYNIYLIAVNGGFFSALRHGMEGLKTPPTP